ncbi:MAG: 3-deoxy-8-phosphooctulonate synthase [Pseudomonadota bacterium]
MAPDDTTASPLSGSLPAVDPRLDPTEGAPAPRAVSIGDARFSHDGPAGLIAGPCQAESAAHAVDIAAAVAEAAAAAGMGYVFKASFDKANRTSLGGKRGLGLDAGLAVLAEVKRQTGLPVITDVHLPEQCAPVAEVCDALQIPAFLCRQTDLLLAAAETGRTINVKKGQFLAPWDMKNVAAKIAETGNPNVLLCERGSSFGYNTLVVDMRGLVQMAATGFPVVFDATHSVQQPGGLGGASGGNRRMAPVLARAAAAVGVAGFFIECHPDPDNAPSDGPNMIPLDAMPGVIARLAAFDRLAKGLD